MSKEDVVRKGQRLGREGLAEPHGPSQGRGEPPQLSEQGSEPMRTASRKTLLGAAVMWKWRAATCGGLGGVPMVLERWAPHLPGPAPRTTCSSCPQASRGSPHPGAAWVALPPCGRGTERGEGSHQPAGPLR